MLLSRLLPLHPSALRLVRYGLHRVPDSVRSAREHERGLGGHGERDGQLLRTAHARGLQRQHGVLLLSAYSTRLQLGTRGSRWAGAASRAPFKTQFAMSCISIFLCPPSLLLSQVGYCPLSFMVFFSLKFLAVSWPLGSVASMSLVWVWSSRQPSPC